jgi:hypothetical protein
MVLLEALVYLTAGGGPVLAIVADEALPATLEPQAGTGAIAAALLLGRWSDADASAPPLAVHPLAVIDELRPPEDSTSRNVEVAMPCESVLPLLDAIRRGRAGRVALGPDPASAWTAAVRRTGGP